MQNNPLIQLPLHLWYLNPNIDAKDPSVNLEYFRKQIDAFNEDIERRKEKQEHNQEIEFHLSKNDIKSIEKMLQKSLNGINITIN